MKVFEKSTSLSFEKLKSFEKSTSLKRFSKAVLSRKGFTIIEVLIAVLVFGLGLLAAYVLIQSASVLALRSKQEIIAGNLLREQIELAKNVRNSNYLAFKRFNSRDDANKTLPCTDSPCDIDTGYFAFSNRYSSSDFPVQVSKLPSAYNFPSNLSNGWKTPGVNEHKSVVTMEAGRMAFDTLFRYCLDSNGRYRLDCAGTDVMFTPYYGFVLVRPLTTAGDTGGQMTVTGALQLDAYFLTTEGGYREFTMSTILTDFKK